jgi:hypothetical protein
MFKVKNYQDSRLFSCDHKLFLMSSSLIYDNMKAPNLCCLSQEYRLASGNMIVVQTWPASSHKYQSSFPVLPLTFQSTIPAIRHLPPLESTLAGST